MAPQVREVQILIAIEGEGSMDREEEIQVIHLVEDLGTQSENLGLIPVGSTIRTNQCSYRVMLRSPLRAVSRAEVHTQLLCYAFSQS